MPTGCWMSDREILYIAQDNSYYFRRSYPSLKREQYAIYSRGAVSIDGHSLVLAARLTRFKDQSDGRSEVLEDSSIQRIELQRLRTWRKYDAREKAASSCYGLPLSPKN
jgi:hypothetical protein